MPVYTPKRLAQAQAAATDTTLYTATAVSCIVKEITVCNTTGGLVALWVSICASGATAGDSNRVICNETIGAYSTVIFSFSQVIAASGFVSAKASAATSLTLTLSGVEFV
jgi:hypothetical protein